LGSGEVLVRRIKGQFPRFELDQAHPLARGVYDAAGRARAPYLLSLYYSGLNRMFKDITDEDDEHFSLALADLASEVFENGRG